MGSRRPRREASEAARYLPLPTLPPAVDRVGLSGGTAYPAYRAVPSRLRLGSDGDARAEDDRSGAGVGVHAEGHHQAQEHPRGQARAAVQLRGLHDALYVRMLPRLLPLSFRHARSQILLA